MGPDVHEVPQVPTSGLEEVPETTASRMTRQGKQHAFNK